MNAENPYPFPLLNALLTPFCRAIIYISNSIPREEKGPDRMTKKVLLVIAICPNGDNIVGILPGEWRRCTVCVNESDNKSNNMCKTLWGGISYYKYLWQNIIINKLFQYSSNVLEPHQWLNPSYVSEIDISLIFPSPNQHTTVKFVMSTANIRKTGGENPESAVFVVSVTNEMIETSGCDILIYRNICLFRIKVNVYRKSGVEKKIE